MQTRFISVFAAFFLLAPASAALGQNDVKVDPDSPSGVEYAIPLERARDHAAKDSPKDKSPGERSAPLFGEGISPRGGKDGGTAGKSDSSDDASSTGQSHRSGSYGGRPVPTSASTPESSGSGSALIGGLAILALLTGTVLGGLIRRRRNS
jgi:hypothetical protein